MIHLFLPWENNAYAGQFLENIKESVTETLFNKKCQFDKGVTIWLENKRL